MALEFNDANFKAQVLDSDKLSVVDFWAEWCGPCRALTPTIEELAKEYDGKVRFFSNDLLMFLKPMKEMFVPVNKFGTQAKGHAELMQQLYESENHLVTFPAGMCSRKVRGKIVDLEWKKNFITKAVQYKRDVVPVYFEGRNSNFFYALANVRKFLKIKFNILKLKNQF